MKNESTSLAFWLLLAALVIVLDQFTKWLIVGHYRLGDVTLGAAAALFIVALLRGHGGQRLFAFSLSMILGGAIGNVIDRVVHGYVVDFLDFHWRFLNGLFHHGHFPAFNVADMAITAGVAGLLLDELLRVLRGRK